MLGISKKFLSVGAFSLSLAALACHAHANTLAIGQTIFYGPAVGMPSLTPIDLGVLTPVAQTSAIPWSTIGSTPETGTLIQEVFRTSGGTLDFAYQVHQITSVTGAGIDQLQTNSFAGFTTSVDYGVDIPSFFSTPTSGVGSSGAANRSTGTGSTVNFGFLSDAIGVGQSSPVFVI